MTIDDYKETLSSIAACRDEATRLRSLFGAEYNAMRERFRDI